MLLKLMPCLTTKSFIDSALPFHATPITVTLSANFWCARSTEGASKLHVLQPGAQNQRATGRCASCSPNVKGEPSRSDAVKSILGPVTVGADELLVDGAALSKVVLGASDVLLLAPPPHAAIITVRPTIAIMRTMTIWRDENTMVQIVQQYGIVYASRLISR